MDTHINGTNDEQATGSEMRGLTNLELLDDLASTRDRARALFMAVHHIGDRSEVGALAALADDIEGRLRDIIDDLVEKLDAERKVSAHDA